MQKNQLKKISDLSAFPMSGLFYLASMPTGEQYSYHGESNQPGFALIHDGIEWKRVPFDTIITLI